MRNRLQIAITLAALLALPYMSNGQSEGTFTLPDSTLLFETTETLSPGAPYEELLVVSDTGTSVVKSPAGYFGEDYNTVFPDLAPGADRIAWGLSKHDTSRKERLKAVLGVYSLIEKSWKTYGEFCVDGVGSLAFSPDGKEVAFASQAETPSDSGYCFHNPVVLQILDLATGRLTPIPYAGSLVENSRLSWSPDGRYVVGQFWCCSAPSIYQIVVIDLSSGSAKVIAKGTDPSWSPNGDWISYEDQKKKECILIHPDGTGARIVQDLRGHWMFLKGAIWSPDGNQLLFNEEDIDGGGNVTILDLPSSKATKRSKNTLYVLGWAHHSGS
jgi:WD40 repeat protein